MKPNRANYARTQREAAKRLKHQAPKPDKRRPVNETVPLGRRTIMPALWLQGFQGLISQALGNRTSRSHRGTYRSDYYQGQATETELRRVRLRKRRAKTKQGRRTRVHQSMAKRGK